MLGSGTVQPGDAVYQQAVRLGRILAKAGFRVCHGGYGGVMEAVARGCHEAGGSNTGITIRKKLTRHNPWVTNGIPMPSWQARLLKLIEMGDAYVFLDGATGTLNELFFVWEMANRKLITKPIILLGKQLHALVKFLRKDPSLKIPQNLHLASSMTKVLAFLKF